MWILSLCLHWNSFVHFCNRLRVFVCTLGYMSVGVAGLGRLRFVCEALEVTGGWCVEQPSLTPAGCSPRHIVSRGQKHIHTHVYNVYTNTLTLNCDCIFEILTHIYSWNCECVHAYICCCWIQPKLNYPAMQLTYFFNIFMSDRCLRTYTVRAVIGVGLAVVIVQVAGRQPELLNFNSIWSGGPPHGATNMKSIT